MQAQAHEASWATGPASAFPSSRLRLPFTPLLFHEGFSLPALEKLAVL